MLGGSSDGLHHDVGKVYRFWYRVTDPFYNTRFIHNVSARKDRGYSTGILDEKAYSNSLLVLNLTCVSFTVILLGF